MEEHIMDLGIYCGLAGLLGARLWDVFFFDWDYYSHHLTELLNVWQGGMAIQGGVLSGDKEGIVLVDVTPLSLGIETLGGVCTKLIDRNTSIPTRKSQVFSTAADNQTSIVNVSSKDLGTGKEQHITITASSNMSKEDIDKAVKDAEMYAAEDAKRKEEVEIRNQGDQMVYQTEKTIADLGDKLDAGEKAEVESKLNALKQALTGTDSSAIKAATEELTQAFYKLSEKLYQQQGGAAGFDPSQAGGAQGTTSNGQDYYDADYTVVDDDK